MRIVHVMAGLGAASGVANIARRFARARTERGDAVVLLAPAFRWNPVCFGLLFAIRAWRAARSADELWVHCSWTFPVWYGAWLARHFGKRLVVVPEGSFDPMRLNNHARWKKRMASPLDRWVLRQADEVLALCPAEISWVRDFEPAAQVRLGRVPTWEKAEGVDEAERAEGPLHVLFLGRAQDPLKGVRYLERAVAEVNAALERSEGPGSRPILLRIVSDHFGEELERDWAWCDVLCLPTLSENFGLVVAEALERGKRVIVTDGAPAWEESGELKVESGKLKAEDGELKVEMKGRMVYVRGYRDGSDADRVRLLKESFRVAERLRS